MRKYIVAWVVFLFIFCLLSASCLTRGVPTTGTFTPTIPLPNQYPSQSNHLIWNGTAEKSLNATNVSVSSVSINFTISDPDGNAMDWYIYHNDSGIWKLLDSDVGVNNGTVATTNVSWLQPFTNYSLSFNVTDSLVWTNETYCFVTGYSIPHFSNEDPPNGSIIYVTSYRWNITINVAGLFNWALECSNGQRSNGTNYVNGTFSLDLSNLVIYTTYTVTVDASNVFYSSTESYTFMVMPTSSEPPSGGGDPSSGIEVAKLSLICIDGQGSSISMVQIDLYDDLKYITCGFTDANGKIEFNLDLPTYVTVKATKEGYETYEQMIYLSQSNTRVIRMYELIDSQLILFLAIIFSAIILVVAIYCYEKKGKKNNATHLY